MAGVMAVRREGRQRRAQAPPRGLRLGEMQDHHLRRRAHAAQQGDGVMGVDGVGESAGARAPVCVA
eukprot:6192651-Pleurochrysis_carterae.AAC.1